MLDNDTKIESIFNSHLLNYDPNKKYLQYELPLKKVKNVLIDLSILLCYDMEPCKEIIYVKHSHLNGISYPIFKECLYDYLDKKEIKLSTMFLAEQNSIPIEELQKIKDPNEPLITNENKIKETLSLTDDINLIMLHRSLYIIKKKFDTYSKEIENVYYRYNEENYPELICDCDKIFDALKEIANISQFDIKKVETFGEVMREEMTYVNKILADEEIKKKFIEFVKKERRKYNAIFKEKKIKKTVDLNSFNNFSPEGDDELVKQYTEKVSTASRGVGLLESAINKEKSEFESNLDSKVGKLPDESGKNEKASERSSNLFFAGGLKKPLPIETIEDVDEDNVTLTKEGAKKTTLNKNTNTKEENKTSSKNNDNIEESEREDSNFDHEKLNAESEQPSINPNKSIQIEAESIKQSYNPNNPLKKFVPPLSTKDELISYFPPKSITYKKYFIYSETLPLIIADFLTSENSLVILDYSDKIRNNLRVLFDNEILERLGEKEISKVNIIKTEQLKELLLSLSKTEQNIKNYNELLLKMKASGSKTLFIEKTLDKLEKTKKWLQDKIQSIQDDTNTYNEYEAAIQKQKQLGGIIPPIKEKEDKEQEEEHSNDNINLIEEKEHQSEIPFHQKQLTPVRIKSDKSLPNPADPLELQSQPPHESSYQIPMESVNKNPGYTQQPTQKQMISETDAFNSQINSKRNQETLNVSLTLSQSENVSVQTSKISKAEKKGYRIKPRREMTTEEKREIAIKEIFYFYSRQHTMVGYKSTFDSIKDKLDHMNLSEFCKFCTEFRILITKQLLIEIFKKTAGNTKEMSLQEFTVSLSKIAKTINDEKIRNLKKKIIGFRKTTTNQNIGNSVLVRQEQIDEEINRMKAEVEILKEKTNQELLEELYAYLEIDNDKEYKKKMKGFNLPYKINAENKVNVNVKPLIGKVKKFDLKTAREIQRMLEERKLESERNKKKIIRYNALNREYQRKKLEKINRDSLTSKGRQIIEEAKKTNEGNGKYVMKDKVKLTDITKKMYGDEGNSNKNEKDKNEKEQEKVPEKKKESKFTWNAIDKMDSNQFMNSNEILDWIV